MAQGARLGASGGMRATCGAQNARAASAPSLGHSGAYQEMRRRPHEPPPSPRHAPQVVTPTRSGGAPGTSRTPPARRRRTLGQGSQAHCANCRATGRSLGYPPSRREKSSPAGRLCRASRARAINKYIESARPSRRGIALQSRIGRGIIWHSQDRMMIEQSSVETRARGVLPSPADLRIARIAEARRMIALAEAILREEGA